MRNFPRHKVQIWINKRFFNKKNKCKKNQNFYRKANFLTKVEIKKKSKILTKIQFFTKNRNF